jgi:hypothetical protein
MKREGQCTRSEIIKRLHLLSVPGAPVFNSALCLEAEEVCLAWNLPDLSKSGCPIHNGTVICEAQDNPELPVIRVYTKDVETEPFIVNVDGLTPCTNYSCVAYITNELTSSENSSVVQFTTKPDGKLARVRFHA